MLNSSPFAIVTLRVYFGHYVVVVIVVIAYVNHPTGIFATDIGAAGWRCWFGDASTQTGGKVWVFVKQPDGSFEIPVGNLKKTPGHVCSRASDGDKGRDGLVHVNTDKSWFL
jgi:hypothetical protein